MLFDVILYSYGGHGATPVPENLPQDLNQVIWTPSSRVEEGKREEGREGEGYIHYSKLLAS